MVTEFKELNIGVESISRWRIDDDLHLPKGGPQSPAYVPINRPLHEVLHRPTLDEKLPDLLQPATIDPDLTEPSLLKEAREDACTLLAYFASRSSGLQKATFERAHDLIGDRKMHEAVIEALATLYRA